jgi:hypothetical protein
MTTNPPAVDEQKLFDTLIAKHFAQVSNVMRRYTERLNAKDREYFMKRALEVGFLHRAEYNPKHQHVATWWQDVCNIVAATRPIWYLEYSTHTQSVYGSQLGRQVI